MGNRVLAIEIGEKLTRICEVDNNKSNLHMYQGITFETPVGAVEDGYIKEKIGLGKTFKEKLSGAKITNNKVVFTISSNKIASREVIVPYVKKQQISQLVQSNASDYFPIKIDEYNIAYNILEVIEEKEKKLRLLVLAIPIDVLQSYYELAELAGLNIVSIDYGGNSSYQVFKKNESQDINMVVHLNDNNGYINILDKDKLLLQRTMPYGSSNIISTVINNPLLQARTRDEAIEVINKNLLDMDTAQHMNEGKLDVLNYSIDEVQSNVSYQDSLGDTYEVIHNIVNNIMRVLDYFSSKENSTVKQIYISCDGITLNYLYELLEKNTGIKVLQYDKFIKLSTSSGYSIDDRLQSQYLMCLGAVINSADLRLRQTVEEDGKHNSALITVVVFGICVVTSIAISLKSYIDYKACVEKKSNLSNQIKELEGVVDIFDNYNATTLLYNKYEEIFNSTINNNGKLDDVIKNIEEKLPVKTRVASFEVTDTGIVLNLQTERKEVIARTIVSLREISYFSNVKNLGYNEEEDENGITVISYTVECIYNSTETSDQQETGQNLEGEEQENEQSQEPQTNQQEGEQIQVGQAEQP
jgi:type IV pilus assembly protein PilN